MRDLPRDSPSSEITPEPLYLRRREFVKNAALMAGTAVTVGSGLLWLVSKNPPPDTIPTPLPVGEVEQPSPSSASQYDTTEPKNSFEEVTSYNNFYEFGTEKEDPAANARTLRTRPWTISLEGEVAKPRVIDIDSLLKLFSLEERIYRMRCVEAWSMVIPWLGFPLANLIKQLEPTGNAKYVEFTTLMDPAQMPGEKVPILRWPYVEGLRLDEALNPLTLIAVGLYGKALPNQNGAPLRLVVPWKYGFKGIKSIVKIRLTQDQPANTWALAAPDEYGFYANVNPHVDHPRWSQATERRIGEFRRRSTLMFNGYGDWVESMYAGMDLRKFF